MNKSKIISCNRLCIRSRTKYKIECTILLLAACCLLPVTGNSQTDEGGVGKVSPKAAEDKLFAGNYEDALTDYLALHAKEPQNDKYVYNLAVCYLNYNGNKTKAIPYLEKLTHNAKHEPNADIF